MSTYLLAWNPRKFPWYDLEEGAEVLREESYWDSDWACAASNRILRGSRVFLMRLGEDPRGIVASGWVLAHQGKTVLPWSDVWKGKHWDPGAESRTTWYVDVRFDALLDRGCALPLSELKRLNEGLPPTAQRQWWTPQKSGIRVGEEVAARLEDEWRMFLASGAGADEPNLGGGSEKGTPRPRRSRPRGRRSPRVRVFW